MKGTSNAFLVVSFYVYVNILFSQSDDGPLNIATRYPDLW